MSIHPGFRDMYEREFASVCRAVFLLSGDRQLSEDAAQEAFARALARWHRLRSHSAPGAWVTTTALNVARRQLRRRPAAGIETIEASSDPEERLELRAAIRALPPRQLEAVALHYLLDMPVSDVAVAMGVDDGTVKTHLARARATLTRALSDPSPEPDHEELIP